MLDGWSASAGRIQDNEKRLPTARQRRIGSLITRRTDLPMTEINLMYLCGWATGRPSSLRSNDG